MPLIVSTFLERHPRVRRLPQVAGCRLRWWGSAVGRITDSASRRPFFNAMRVPRAGAPPSLAARSQACRRPTGAPTVRGGRCAATALRAPYDPPIRQERPCLHHQVSVVPMAGATSSKLSRQDIRRAGGFLNIRRRRAERPTRPPDGPRHGLDAPGPSRRSLESSAAAPRPMGAPSPSPPPPAPWPDDPRLVWSRIAATIQQHPAPVGCPGISWYGTSQW